MIRFENDEWNKTLEGFLTDIRAHPADDLARLALADWLEERSNAPVPKRCKREIEDSRKHAANWAKLLRHQCFAEGPGDWLSQEEEWERGLSQFTLAAQQEPKNGGCWGSRGLLQRHLSPTQIDDAPPPWVDTHLVFSESAYRMPIYELHAFLHSPAASQATSLSVCGRHRDEQNVMPMISTIIDSGLPLKSLFMEDWNFRTRAYRDSLTALLQSPLPLESLDLSHSYLDSDAITAIAQSGSRIKSLTLVNAIPMSSPVHGFSVTDIKALTQSRLPLRVLNLGTVS